MNKKTNHGFSLRKLLLTAMVAGPLATLPAPMWALPSVASTNLTVSGGAPAPTTVSTTRLDFGTPLAPVPDRSIYSWVEFGSVANPIGATDQLNYFLPSTTSSVLNLVSAQQTTSTLINGQIASNGNVWVLNPNGVIIGGSAQIATGGFFVSTVPDSLATSTFVLNGKPSFTAPATAGVVVQPGANIQALGTNNAISLYGKSIDVQGGNFFGNLNLQSFGGAVTLGSAGPVTVNAIGSTTAGGKLAITTGGGGVSLSGGGLVLSAQTKAAATTNPAGASGLSVVANTSTANATFGQITGFTFGTGTGYTAAPTVTIDPAPLGGTNATATATVNANGQVTGFVVSGGTGYTAAPAVTISGSGGTGAVATAVQTGGVVSLVVGTGYTATPAVVFTDGGTSYTVTPTGGTIANGGYTALPTAATLPTYAGALANAVTVAGTVAIDAGGGSVGQGASQFFAVGGNTTFVGGTTGNVFLPKSNLLGFSGTANNVFILENGGTSATATPDFTLGASTIVGNLTVDMSAGNNGNIAASGATAVGGVASLQTSNNTLTFTGSGNVTFTNLRSTSTTTITGNGDLTLPNANRVQLLPVPAITAAPSTGTTVTIGSYTFNAAGQLTGVTIANGGSGYTAAPSITFSQTSYTTQTLTTTIGAGGVVTGVNVTAVPFFTSVPAVAVTPAPVGGTNATVSSITLNGFGQLTSVGLAGGTGYTTAPTVIVNGPNGALAETGTASLVAGVPGATTFAGQSGGIFTQGRTLSVTSSGGKISTGIFSVASTITLIAAGDITLGGASSPGSTLSITSSGGKIASNFFAAGTNGNITASGNINLGAYQSATGGAQVMTSRTGAYSVDKYLQTGGGTNTITAVGDITVPTTLSTTSGALTLTSTSGTISVTGSIISSTTALLSLTAAGNIVLPTSTVAVMSVTSTAGSITQAAVGQITQNGTSTSNKVTLNALNDILLLNGQNDFLTLVLVNGGGGANGIQVADTNSVILGGGTAAKGNVSVNSGVGAGTTGAPTGTGFIQLGALVVNALGQNVNGADTLQFAGNLNLFTTGAATINNKNNPLSNGGLGLTGSVNTFANNILVVGAVYVQTSGNNNAYLGTPGLGNLAKYSFGQVNGNVGTGILTVNENTTLNLGTIVAGTLTASSLGGNIVSSGAITANTVNLSANTIFAPGNITLDNAGNLIDTVNILNATDATLTLAPRTLATTTVTAGSSTVDGRAVVGTALVTALGNVAMTTAGGGDYGTVGFTASGAANVTITDPNGVTLQNATNSGTGAVTLNVAGPITLGSSINLGSTGVTTLNSTGLNANISDNAAGVAIFGPTVLVSDNSIAITKAGHSLGSVSLVTTGNNGANGTANITYTESGSANLNAVAVNSSGNALVPAGSLTVTSTGGSVLQTAVAGTFPAGAIAGTILVPSPTGSTNTATFTAPTGGVTLTAATNNIAVPVALSAAGNSSVSQSTGTGLTLGNIVVTNGTFTADASAAAGKLITENTGATIRVLGATSFLTQGGAISVNQTGNNFGGLTLSSNVGNAGGAPITIKEAGTINLVSVTTGTLATSSFTATSESGGIIQTGTAGLVVGGPTSLTAGTAGVNLNTGTTSNTFGGANGIQVVSAGNVSIQDANATTLILGGTNINGSATFRNTNGAGTIKDGGGAIAITGATAFDAGRTGASAINISGGNSSFGAITFNAGTGGVNISETGTLNIAAGSSSGGNTSLTSFGNIVTSGTGGSTFTGTLRLTAFGSITISNPIFVQGQLTFSSVGATDLSILSKAGNLNFLDPINLGAASYKAPGP